MKKKSINLFIVILFAINCYSQQVSSSFNVGGDIDKYYPVTFFDGAWNENVPTELKIGRSNTHNDENWRGSLMASFRYHTSNWGHGSNFIDADIIPSTSFVAGWRDATPQGTCGCIIIWLRGGSTTYFYQSNYAVNPVVYDGIQNPLPYNEVNGPVHSFKTIADNYVNSKSILQNLNVAGNFGIGTTNPRSKFVLANGNDAVSINSMNSISGLGFNREVIDGTIFNSSISAWQFTARDNMFTLEGFNGAYSNPLTVLKNGNVGIGTTDPKNKLSVNGTVWAKEVKVSLTDAADWVFDRNYKLKPLAEVEKYINDNKHLPEIPSAEEFRQNDLNVSEMTNKLLQKIEELTLYTIEQDKKINLQANEMDVLKKENQNFKSLSDRLSKIEKALE